MLTAILKSRTIGAFVLTYLIGIGALVYSILVLSPGSASEDLLLAHWAFGWMENHAVFLPYLSVLIISVTAIISRLRMGEVKLALGSRNLSTVAFVALILVQPNALLRPDILMAMSISTAMFLLLLSTYKRESVLSQMFHVGLLLGLATLFVGQSLLLVVSIGFSILILRTGNWKEWMVLLLGLGMILVFVLMFTIWHDQPIQSLQGIIQSAWSGIRNNTTINAGHMALVPVVLLSMLGILNGLTVGNVAERNITAANGSWLAGVILIVFVLGFGWQNGIIMAAFPLSVLIARTLEDFKRWWIADLLLLALISAPFIRTLWQL